MPCRSARLRWRRPGKWAWLWSIPALAILATVTLCTVHPNGYRYRPLAERLADSLPAGGGGATAPSAQGLTKLERENRQLATALENRIPKGSHLIIDQTHNRLLLRKGTETLLEAVCSAGGGVVLIEAGGGNRKWIFDTPRGRFAVLRKIENPVWKKPDWAFLEEGLPIPKDPGERFEYGMLGEYALYFGNGYMIHGTLYERLLGRSVTHGCIRLGRDDLRKVFESCPVGTAIYIY
ncbi:MAG: L,D-transpeptidase [Candidatus Eisenbacteria bacterium]